MHNTSECLGVEFHIQAWLMEGKMADRQVTQSRKDGDGDITALAYPIETMSLRSKQEVISDIENSIHTYYVHLSGGSRVNIHVVNGPSGKYLRTSGDSTERNNLDDLPDC